MYPRDLVEFAAVLAAHGPAMVFQHQTLISPCLEQYWSASKCRLDRWSRAVRTFNRRIQDPGTLPEQREQLWREIRPVLEEILTGEILTRVWTALVCVLEQRYSWQSIEPVARSIYIGHLEARHRTLNLIIYGRQVNSQHAEVLNRLRRRCECWNDILLGYLQPHRDILNFCFDERRTKNFVQQLTRQRHFGTPHHVHYAIPAMLRTAFGEEFSDFCPNADLNEQIAAGILACLDADLFDSSGAFKSLWAVKFSTAATDRLGLLESLLCEYHDETDPPPEEPPWTNRLNIRKK